MLHVNLKKKVLIRIFFIFCNILGLTFSFWIGELKKTQVSSIRKVLRGGRGGGVHGGVFLLPYELYQKVAVSLTLLGGFQCFRTG